jgi:hypothetical protein
VGVQGFANDLSNWFEGFEKFRLYYESETKKAGLKGQKFVTLQTPTQDIILVGRSMLFQQKNTI